MKLPVGYVAGKGVVKASGYGGLGQRMLEKMGWQKGQGLGKEKDGMTDALEVKKKEDTLGVSGVGMRVMRWRRLGVRVCDAGQRASTRCSLSPPPLRGLSGARKVLDTVGPHSRGPHHATMPCNP